MQTLIAPLVQLYLESPAGKEMVERRVSKLVADAIESATGYNTDFKKSLEKAVWTWNHLAVGSLASERAIYYQIGGVMFDRLRYGRCEKVDFFNLRRDYPSRALALYDLSLAVVDFGRERAGLSPWPRVKPSTRRFANGRFSKKEARYYEIPQDADPFYNDFLGYLEGFDSRAGR